MMYKFSSKKHNFTKKATLVLLSLALTTAISAQNITVNANGVSFEMVPVEGGTFWMGAQKTDPSGQNYDPNASSNESPVHQVTLDSYYIGQTEVTEALWEAVMGNNPSYFYGDNHPVEQVSWEDCQTFLNTLNELTGFTFRLPTEAEWEFAARGGNNSQGYYYSGSNTASNVAWYFSVSGWLTHDVATLQPNELGVYDMSGNVWEWCSDWMDDYPSTPQVNPQGPDAGAGRVARGGSWMDEEALCTVTSRAAYNQDNAGLFLGLRLATSDNLLSLNENTEERIQVYPNPTRNSVIVAAEGMSHVAVLSLLGQVVFEADVRGDEAVLDLSQLEAGVYVVRVTTQSGVVTKQISLVK